MGDIILTDLVPIFVIMILGYLSGKRKAFSAENSRSFNKLVLNYALPAALFLSIVKGNREMLFGDLMLLISSFVIIILCYFISFFCCMKIFKHTKGEAAISGLIGGAPTIGFLGFAVLTPIYGASATTGLVVAIVAIIVNAIAIPIGLYLLNPQANPEVQANLAALAKASGIASPTEPVASTSTATTTAAPVKPKKKDNALLNALKEPVVWSPIIAVIFILIGIRFPVEIEPIFDLIAKSNAGVAVFAAGLTLSYNKFQFDTEVIFNTFIKLILMPALFLGFGLLLKMDPIKLQMLVLCGALPPVFSGIIIGRRYQIYVRTGTSSLAVSMILFMGTAPLWIWIARLVGGG